MAESLTADIVVLEDHILGKEILCAFTESISKVTESIVVCTDVLLVAGHVQWNLRYCVATERKLTW